ncbi:hypothetical protein AB0E69_30355 [Kribbella sp. NPDC026611]|uniref:hypothetical protein n=1 Tax=Kribbella sp. NPDC026611 TaxID=3154911 RepID=UPI0033F03645
MTSDETADDLQRLFRTMADEGSQTVAVDEDVLVPQIRRNRRQRGVLATLSAAVAIAAVTAGAYAVLPESQPPLAAPSAVTTSLPTKDPGRLGNGPVCGGMFDKGFPPRIPSGMDGLDVKPAKVHRTTAGGWTGSLEIEVTPPTRVDQLRRTVRLDVTWQRKVVGHATLTMRPGAGRHSIVYHVEIVTCDQSIPPGTVVLYGELRSPKNPMTIFPVQLG